MGTLNVVGGGSDWSMVGAAFIMFGAGGWFLREEEREELTFRNYVLTTNAMRKGAYVTVNGKAPGSTAETMNIIHSSSQVDHTCKAFTVTHQVNSGLWHYILSAVRCGVHV